MLPNKSSTFVFLHQKFDCLHSRLTWRTISVNSQSCKISNTIITRIINKSVNSRPKKITINHYRQFKFLIEIFLLRINKDRIRNTLYSVSNKSIQERLCRKWRFPLMEKTESSWLIKALNMFTSILSVRRGVTVRSTYKEIFP